jgi:hypothetical protein
VGVGASAAMRAGAAVPRRPRRRPQRPPNDASHPLPLSHLEQTPLRRQAGHILVVRRPEHAAGARGAGGGEGGDPRVGGAAGGVGGCLKRLSGKGRSCGHSRGRRGPRRPTTPRRDRPGPAHRRRATRCRGMPPGPALVGVVAVSDRYVLRRLAGGSGGGGGAAWDVPVVAAPLTGGAALVDAACTALAAATGIDCAGHIAEDVWFDVRRLKMPGLGSAAAVIGRCATRAAALGARPPPRPHRPPTPPLLPSSRSRLACAASS